MLNTLDVVSHPKNAWPRRMFSQTRALRICFMDALFELSDNLYVPVLTSGLRYISWEESMGA